MEKGQQNSFGFTSCVWHELYFKRLLFENVELAIQELNISNYTQSPKIKEIFFTIQANPTPVDRIFYCLNHFAYKKGIIFLYGKIDYEIFKNATEKEALALMCTAYLDAILSIPNLRGMKKVPFDAQKLHQDLYNIFVEKGFLR